MTDDTIEKPVERRIGPYQLIREAGRGGMSTVYEAVDSRDGRIVAVKALVPTPHLSDEEQHKHLTRLQREADALARLNHPNLVNVLDMGTVGDTPETRVHYLVLEYVNGETLSDRISRTGPLPLHETTAIVAQIAGALDAAHAAGIVHRDVKPGNIILQPDGDAKLMDFGVARLQDDAEVTRPGTIIGSPAYMSPEQAKGEAVTAASDQWSLAAVLYAMLSGRSPFAAENIPATLYQVTHGIAGPIPDVSPAVMRVFARAFDRNPGRRFPSGVALVAAFGDALEGRNPAVHAPVERATVMPIAGTAPADRKPTGKGPSALLWLPLGAVVLLVGSLFSATLKEQNRQAASPVAVASVSVATAPTGTPGTAPALKPPPLGPRRVATAPTPRPVRPAAEVMLPPTVVTTPVLPEPARAPALTKPVPTPRPSPTPLVAIIVERTPAPILLPRGTPTPRTTPAPRVQVAQDTATPTPAPAPTPTREGTATSSLKPATPAPKPQISRPATTTVATRTEDDTAEPPADRPISEETLSFVGTWRGTHTGSPATLVVKSENAESDTFDGVLTVQTATGAVAIAVKGRLLDENGSPEVVLEERRVVTPSTPRMWDLGTNTGRLNGPDSMSGSGQDHRGRSYSWSFQR